MKVYDTSLPCVCVCVCVWVPVCACMRNLCFLFSSLKGITRASRLLSYMSFSTRSHRQDVDNIVQTPPLFLLLSFFRLPPPLHATTRQYVKSEGLQYNAPRAIYVTDHKNNLEIHTAFLNHPMPFIFIPLTLADDTNLLLGNDRKSNHWLRC